MRRWVGVAFVVMACLACSCSKKKEQGTAPANVTEGVVAPGFTALDLAGKEMVLADLRGKVVLVNFWATWCPPCREEIPSMVKLNQIMAGKPFQMLALSVDEGGKPAIEEFLKRKGLSLPVLIDNEQRVAKSYGVSGVPRSFIIDKKGVIRKKIIGGLEWSAPDTVQFLTDLCAQ
jgi:peroxiredoxin